MPSSKPDLLATLDWLIVSGADEAVGETPANHFVAAANPVAESVRRSGTSPGPASFAKPVSRTPSTGSQLSKPPMPSGTGTAAGATGTDSIGDAMGIAAACHTLGELHSALEAFDGCGLKKTATKTVFADGTPHHGIMFIGEAPGRDEDMAGLPFVGRAGKLLDKMLASIGLDRTTNAYITNVINWRPPGNRDPSPEEAASCLPFLRRHIELVSPEIIVLLGAVASRHVMGRSDGIMRLRGKWLEYYVNGTMVPVMPTLHPAYLLRRAVDKKLAWRDLQEISQKVNTLGLLEHAAERS